MSGKVPLYGHPNEQVPLLETLIKVTHDFRFHEFMSEACNHPHIEIFWAMTPCSLAGGYEHFVATHRLNFFSLFYVGGPKQL
jgi:hypothetical protein